MFDHDNCVTQFNQRFQYVQQILHIREMKPGCRFIQDVERLARVRPAELLGEFDALGFPAGQRRSWLPELDVAHADVDQNLENTVDRQDVPEQACCLLDLHLENVRDRLLLEPGIQGFPSEPAAFAYRAGDPDISKKIHLHQVGAVALTGFTTSSLDVEAEATRFVSANF